MNLKLNGILRGGNIVAAWFTLNYTIKYFLIENPSEMAT